MCRHFAYLGSERSLAELMLAPAHSLLHQSHAPADMRGGGSVNADGFGVGWIDGEGRVRRYRRGCPMWADGSLPDLAATIRSPAVLAATRNGTVGLPVMESACAPFTDGHWLFSHNGMVPDWQESLSDLAKELPTAALVSLDAPTDSALLWALLRHRLDGGIDPARAVGRLTAQIGESVPGARLNLLLSDGDVIVATTWTHALSVRRDDTSVLVSSEPWELDDPAWQQVPDGRLVVATPTDLSLSQIEPEKGST